MPHLGVLAQVHPEASLEVFERDCLVYLGTCVAPRGQGKAGRPCFRFSLTTKAGVESGVMNVGEMRSLPLADGEVGTMAVEPEKGFDVGAGPGKPVQREVRGGAVGVVLDARGRPLVLPGSRAESSAAMGEWVRRLDLYDERGAAS
jgi:hypothetical protein